MISVKRLALFLLAILVIATACKKDKKEETEEVYKTSQSYTLSDIAYGSNSEQDMDIYLPANRSTSSTKVFVLIHGGGWSAGDKADFDYMFTSLKTYYPNHAIININYRLGTSSSPGYPKQINDIQAALNHIQLAKYEVSTQYFLIGASAGGHLSLLYGYAFDANQYVKGICNVVGPTDFTDPSYTDNALYQYALTSFVGSETYTQNPQLHAEVSPALRVTTSSPKTISFYGDQDPLIPSTQMGRLHDELNAKGIINQATMYPGEGHGNWNQAHSNDYVTKLVNFINQYFN
jgi:acetyl esterase/lipase